LVGCEPALAERTPGGFFGRGHVTAAPTARSPGVGDISGSGSRQHASIHSDFVLSTSRGSMFWVWRQSGSIRRCWRLGGAAGLAALSVVGCAVDERVVSVTEPEGSAGAGAPAPNRDQPGVGSGGTSNQPGVAQASPSAGGNSTAAPDLGTD